MSLKHDNLMCSMIVQMLSLLKRNYLIVSSDSLLIMCQSVNIITPKRKQEVIWKNIFNKKRWLPSYHTGYTCIHLALDITTPYTDVKYAKDGQLHSMSWHFLCTLSSYQSKRQSISKFRYTETNKPPLKDRQRIYLHNTPQ